MLEKVNDLIFSGDATNIQLGFLLLKSLGYSESYCKDTLKLFIEKKLNSFDWQQVTDVYSKETKFDIVLFGLKLQIGTLSYLDAHYKRGGKFEIRLFKYEPNNHPLQMNNIIFEELISTWDGYCKVTVDTNRQNINAIVHYIVEYFFKQNPFN